MENAQWGSDVQREAKETMIRAMAECQSPSSKETGEDQTLAIAIACSGVWVEGEKMMRLAISWMENAVDEVDRERQVANVEEWGRTQDSGFAFAWGAIVNWLDASR